MIDFILFFFFRATYAETTNSFVSRLILTGLADLGCFVLIQSDVIDPNLMSQYLKEEYSEITDQ